MGVGDGQGGLACSSWGRKESDTTERLNWTEEETAVKREECFCLLNSNFEHLLDPGPVSFSVVLLFKLIRHGSDTCNKSSVLSTLELLFSCQVMSNSFVTAWTVVLQAPLSMRFPRQEFWSGLPFPFPGVSWPKDQAHISCIVRRVLYHWITREALMCVCVFIEVWKVK